MKTALTSADLNYIGAFRLPTSPSGGGDGAWGRGFAIRRVNGILHYFTVPNNGPLYEGIVPTPAATGTGPVATVWRTYKDAVQADGTLNGLHWDATDSRLYWTYGNTYNTGATNIPSFGYTTFNDATGVASRFQHWGVQSHNQKQAMGGMTDIPSWFVTAYSLGTKRLGIGFGGYWSIVANGPASFGPALAAFAPITTETAETLVPSTNLLGFDFNSTPYTNPQRERRSTDYTSEFAGDWPAQGTTGYWTWADWIWQGAVWVDTANKSGLLAFPSIGTGRVWYQTSTLHATNLKHALYIYDPVDLGAVITGSKQQYEAFGSFQDWKFPNLTYPLPGWADEPWQMVTGVSFDPTDNKLYVCVRFATNGGQVFTGVGPVVYVYQVTDTVATPPRTTATLRVTDTGNATTNATNLQAALDAAQPGDTIVLDAGARFAGTATLPQKTNPSNLEITVTTSGTIPAAGTRITPAFVAQMPVLSPVGNNQPALRTCLPASGVASYWRLIGLNFEANTYGGDTIVAIGSNDSSLSNKQDTAAKVPHHITIERCYIHGQPYTGQLHGLGLHGRYVTVKDNYIADCWAIGQDAQAIWGCNGLGDYTITNNYLEGAGENVLMGGDDPRIPNLVPTGMLFERNDLVKPVSWRNPILGTPTGLTIAATTGGSIAAGTFTYTLIAARVSNQGRTALSTATQAMSVSVPANGKVTLTWTSVDGATRYLIYRSDGKRFETTSTSFTDTGDLSAAISAVPPTNSSGSPSTGTLRTVKNVFELKNFATARVRGNRLSKCWGQSQVGYPVVFTPANQLGGNPSTVVRDIIFEYNWVDGAPGGVNISSYDATGKTSQRTSNITIRHNLFTDIDLSWALTGTQMRVFLFGADQSGNNPREGIDGLTIEHNTVLQSSSLASLIYMYGYNRTTGLYDTIPNAVIRNNIFRRSGGISGDNSSEGTNALGHYMPGGIFTKNVIQGATASKYPELFDAPTESTLEDQFVDYAGGNYRIKVASTYHNAATDGTDLGADIDGLTVAYGNTVCTYVVAPTTVSVTSGAQTSTIGITAAASCGWSAVSSASWITVSPATGTGSGTVTLTIAANVGAARQATVTVAGVQVGVSQDAAIACTYSVTPITLTADSSGGSFGVTITASAPTCAWTVSGAPAWVTPSAASGTGTTAITLTVVAYGSTTPRTASFTIAGQSITVTQQGTTCSYSLSAASASVVAAGVTDTVDVTATAGCSWTASSNVPWVTVLDGASGTGDGTVTYSVQQNTSSARSGTLTIAGQLFTISQDAVCSYNVTPTTILADAAGGDFEIAIVTGASCAWALPELPEWIVPDVSSGTGSATVTLTIAPYTATDAPRSVSPDIEGEMVIIWQAPAACSFALNATSTTVAAAGGSASVDVTTTSGCSWTAASNAVWIVITSADHGENSSTVTFAVAANVASAARTGTLTIAGTTFTVTQDGADPADPGAVSPPTPFDQALASNCPPDASTVTVAETLPPAGTPFCTTDDAA